MTDFGSTYGIKDEAMPIHAFQTLTSRAGTGEVITSALVLSSEKGLKMQI